MSTKRDSSPLRGDKESGASKPTPPTRPGPFFALEALRGKVPEGTVSPAPSTEPTSEIVRGPARAVVRLERKQRRGKDVTVVEKLGLSKSDLESWCSDLKRALGCGGAVENDAIVLQGDLRKRLPELLTKKGVRTVTVG